MKIAIIGCGYVGKELAKLWNEEGHSLTCTTRSSQNLKTLDPISQKSLVLDSNDQNEISLLNSFNDLLVVTLAPDSKEEYEETYLKAAKNIRLAALESNQPKTLFYTSSTAVYGEHQGHWVDENASLNTKTEQGEILIETEKTYLSLMELGWRVCIFRLSEIYGPRRDLKTKIENLQNHVLPGKGQNYTNMIHLDDITSGIDYALKHKLSGIFNLTDDDHPKRIDFYNELCNQLKKEPIHWNSGLTRLHSGNRRVSNHKIKAEGYTFKFPHRILPQ